MGVVRKALLNRKSGQQASTRAGLLARAISPICMGAFVEGLISETVLRGVSLKKNPPAHTRVLARTTSVPEREESVSEKDDHQPPHEKKR